MILHQWPLPQMTVTQWLQGRKKISKSILVLLSRCDFFRNFFGAQKEFHYWSEAINAHTFFCWLLLNILIYAHAHTVSTSLKPTFLLAYAYVCEIWWQRGSTTRKWHRSLSIWLQQVRQRWWAGHFDSIIWIACHFAEDVSTYQEYVAMYQEHVWTHLKKLLQRISNIWQVTVRRGDNVSGRSCNLLTSRKMLQRIRNVLQATWRRCCKKPGTSFKGLEEDVTTSCMEHVGSVAQKMSQCIRKGLQVIWRRCYNVSGTSGKLL